MAILTFAMAVEKNNLAMIQEFQDKYTDNAVRTRTKPYFRVTKVGIRVLVDSQLFTATSQGKGFKYGTIRPLDHGTLWYNRRWLLIRMLWEEGKCTYFQIL